MKARRVHVESAEELPRLEGAAWLARIDAALADPSARPLKDYGPSSSTVTYQVDLVGIGPSWLKQYRLNSPRRLLSPFRMGRARRVWGISRALLEAGHGVPEPYLVVEEIRAGFMTRSFLVTEWLDGRVSLADWYRKAAAGSGIGAGVVEEAVFDSVMAAAGFHARGVIHGDLKWSNFLLADQEQRGIVLVDLDAARFSTRPERRGKDLARFAISALEEGMPAETVGRVFEVYRETLRPSDPDRIRKAYEGYVRKKAAWRASKRPAASAGKAEEDAFPG